MFVFKTVYNKETKQKSSFKDVFNELSIDNTPYVTKKGSTPQVKWVNKDANGYDNVILGFEYKEDIEEFVQWAKLIVQSGKALPNKPVEVKTAPTPTKADIDKDKKIEAMEGQIEALTKQNSEVLAMLRQLVPTSTPTPTPTAPTKQVDEDLGFLEDASKKPIGRGKKR